jgi:glycosyltransferase involved in cell wall biosynthesis
VPLLAIFLTYGIDNCIQAALSKGNFDQMKAEIENLSKLSNVYLLTRDRQNYCRLFGGNIEHLSCKLFSQSDTTSNKIFGSIIFFLVGFLLIMRRLKKIDLVVSQGTTTVHAALANFLFRTPHILFVHYFAYREQFLLKRRFPYNILKGVESFAINHCTLVIALTRSLKSEVSRYGVKSVLVVPNFIDLKEVAKLNDRDTLRKKLRLDKKSKIVLFVGRLHPVKNIDTLLKSFGSIRSQSCCNLVIIGDGPERQRLINLAKSLGISTRVFFEGFKKRSSVLEYMKASDVLVLPSIIEGQPRVVLEAWAAGLPVVASKRPGLETLINDGVDGLLFELGDEEGLAKVISVALDDETATKMAFNAKKKVANYDAAKVLSNQANIVRKFLHSDVSPRS